MAIEAPRADEDVRSAGDNGDEDDIARSAATSCGCDVDQIEDIFPCTPLQEGMLAMTAKDRSSYVSHMTHRLSRDADVAKLKQAIGKTYSTIAILRARIVDIEGLGLVQVVIKDACNVPTYATVEACLESQHQKAFGLGDALSGFAVVNDTSTQQMTLVTSLHHAVYDGYTLDLVFKAIEHSYLTGLDSSPSPPFQNFVNHILQVDYDAASSFWKAQLAESEAPVFPYVPALPYVAQPSQFCKAHFDNIPWTSSGVTPSTVIRAAWSLLTAKYTNGNEAIFGITTTGRQADVPEIESMAGPTIATLPIRTQVDWGSSLRSWLQAIQTQSIEMIPFEQFGLQNIRQIDHDVANASHFQTLLVVQPKAEAGTSLGYPFEEDAAEVSLDEYGQGLMKFNSYALMLECTLTDDGFNVSASFDGQVLPQDQLSRLLDQLGHIARELCRSDGPKVSDVSLVPSTDLESVWTWNGSLPEQVDRCIHEIITEQCHKSPEALAIDAWDGAWTYRQLDDLSSLLATLLVEVGVKPGQLVPICFEKSKWMPIAMLAVTKAGGASATMDPTQPEERLRNITEQAVGPVMISSVSNAALARRLTARQCIALDETLLSGLTGQKQYHPDPMSPSEKLCIVFTSGSTGKPKGSIITHSNFSTAIRHHQRFLNIKPGSRLYDFSSYAFDATWSNMFHTLAYGGCVCIPNDERRKNALEASIAEMNSTFVFMTPSIARALEPSRLKCLETIVIGGEAINEADISRWSKYTRVIVAYGPTECTIYSSFTDKFFTTQGGASIGVGCGLNTWIVDPDNPLLLTPVGAVGELLLEGPLLAPGYLNNEQKSAEAFLTNPPWLLAGGRSGRLYKTGDLVRYTNDGTLLIIGRKDSQVKVRGQRVEMGDVEHHIREFLKTDVQIVVEVIVPQGAKSSMLVAFFGVAKQFDKSPERIVQELTEGLEQTLLMKLPTYMIPAAYIPIQGSVPMTTTGKVDRKSLRETGSKLTREQIAQLSSSQQTSRLPQTPNEEVLQQLWADVIGIEAKLIHAESHFFRVGGDSISAMRLVNAAQVAGYGLTVADIFKHPQLCDLAGVLAKSGSRKSHGYRAFSHVKQRKSPETWVQEHVLPKLKATMGLVVDVLPVTATQTQYINAALQVPPRQWNYFHVDLQADISDAKLARICQALWDQLDALRLIFIPHGQQYLQAIVSDSQPNMSFHVLEYDVDTIMKRCVTMDLSLQPELGTSFTHFFVLRSRRGQLRLMTRMSHAQYDGIALGTFSDVLAASLRDQSEQSTPQSFALYMNHCISNRSASCQYWASLLRGSQVTRLAKHGGYTNGKESAPDSVSVQTIAPSISPMHGNTAATTFLAHCVAVLRRLCKTDDLVIGALVSGRAMLPPDLKDTFGACLNTVPLRVEGHVQDSHEAVCESVREAMTASMPFETMTFEEIAQSCTDWVDQHPGIVIQYQNADEQPQPVAEEVLSPLRFVERDPYVQDERVSILARPSGDGLILEVAAKKGVYNEDVLSTLVTELKAALD